MNVKGTALIARRTMYVPRVGEAEWNAFFDEFVAREPSFPRPLLATSAIPVDVVLRFNDQLIARFFGGRREEYWALGELTADFASKAGPYVGLFQKGDYRTFATVLPTFWRNFYDDGEAVARELPGGVVDVEIRCPVRHVYFELSTMGFVARGLTLKGVTVETRALAGPSRGDRDIHYQFVVKT